MPGKTGQRTAEHADSLATLQIAMRLERVRPGKARANRFDVFVWHGSRMTMETNQFRDAGDLQNLQPVSQRHVHENIAGEKR